MQLAGFKDISIIAEQKGFNLYEAFNAENNLPCLLRASSNPDKSGKPGYIQQRELNFTREYGVSNVIRGRKILNNNGNAVLLMDHFGGLPLNFYLKAFPNNIALMLRIARGILKILSELHAEGIIHRAIDDKCILLSDPAANDVLDIKLTYLGLSGSKSGYQDIPNLYDYFDFISLEYMAPELAGIVKIKSDQRADLYSLGILFYKMLTGSVPFRLNNRIEALHWIQSEKPESPKKLNGSVPGVLSDIVMLLLEKEPEKRYDNTLSLLKDIENCRSRTGDDGAIQSFNLKQSFTSEIPFTDDLYGRENEKRSIIEFLDSVSRGSGAVTFISGYAGTGKTALVKSINEEVIKRGGLMITGKADQFMHEIPYGVFFENMRTIAKLLLLMGDNELEELRKKIIKKLGSDIRLLSDIIPELEHLTGTCEKTVEPYAENTENRFKRILSEFLRIIAERNMLVFFLDDMHWTDPATFNIVKYLIEQNIAGLYIMGAYRDNEVNENHPLNRLVSEAGRSSAGFNVIRLNALDYRYVEAMLIAALSDDSDRIKKLAQYVFNKTGGNPFYIRKFLQLLLSQECLSYKNNHWTWDENKSKKLPPAENVLHLLASMIEKIDRKDQEVLKTASCIGNYFSHKFLEVVLDFKHKRLLDILNRLVKSDYLIRESVDTYAFSHDRIQEAGLGLLSAEEKPGIHKKIGNMLLRLHGSQDAHIFEITDHLNLAIDEYVSPELVNLNFSAGLRAKSNFAYAAASKYFETAGSLYLKTEIENNDLLYDIHKNYMESLYLNADYENAEKAALETMKLTDKLAEKADLYNILVMIKIIEVKYEDAVKIGLEALALFNIVIEQDIVLFEKQIVNERDRLSSILKNITDEEIVNLPLCGNLEKQKLALLLKNVSTSFYHVGNWKTCYLLSAKMVDLTLSFGLAHDSPEGIIVFGMTGIVIWNDYQSGNRLGEIAYKLCNQLNNLSQISSVGMHFAAYILYWKKHLRETIEILTTSFNAGIKSGEYMFAGYSIGHLFNNYFTIGRNLVSLLEDIDKEIILIAKVKNKLFYYYLIGLKLIISNLSGKSKDRESFNIQYSGEMDYFNEINDKNISFSLFFLYKANVFYLYGKYQESLSLLFKIQEQIIYMYGMFSIVEHSFYLSLNLAALIAAKSDNSGEYSELLSGQREKLKEWAAECPANFQCRHFLIEAEFAKISGDFMSAMFLYDKSIASAGENEYIEVEGIACERAAIFWLSLGKEDFADLYLKRAYACFNKWGAFRKLEQLKEQYPGIFHGNEPELDELKGSEIIAFLKHLNVLSNFTDTVHLLDALCDIVLRHLGAELFALMIEQDGKMLVQVFGTAASGQRQIMQSLPLEGTNKQTGYQLPVEMIRYLNRTGEKMIYYDRNSGNIFHNIPYMAKRMPRSAVCVKADTGRCKVIFYLENRSATGAFLGINRILLDLLSRHAVICIQNAMYLQEHKDAAERLVSFNRFLEKLNIDSYEKIIYLSSHGRHTIVHTENETLDMPVLLKDIEKELPGELFIRIHKQYIVNQKHISRFKRDAGGRYVLSLNDDDDSLLPVGRSYYSIVKKRLMS